MAARRATALREVHIEIPSGAEALPSGAEALPSGAEALPSGAAERPVAATPATSTHSPVIILDVDGVLHPLRPPGFPLHASMEDVIRRGEAECMGLPEGACAEVLPGEFTEPCMAALAQAVHGTGAEIVLSSTWRETAPQRLAVDRQLIRAGLPASSGRTPQLTAIEGRAREVLRWVESARPTCWVAIDDMPLADELPDGHFVQTDPATGLTEEDAERVCAALCAQQRLAIGITRAPRARRGGVRMNACVDASGRVALRTTLLEQALN